MFISAHFYIMLKSLVQEHDFPLETIILQQSPAEFVSNFLDDGSLETI